MLEQTDRAAIHLLHLAGASTSGAKSTENAPNRVKKNRAFNQTVRIINQKAGKLPAAEPERFAALVQDCR